MKKEDFEQLESQRHRNKLDEMNLRYKRQDFNAAQRAWESLSREEQYERNVDANNDNLVHHAIIVFVGILSVFCRFVFISLPQQILLCMLVYFLLLL